MGLFVYAIKATHTSKKNVSISHKYNQNRHQVLRRNVSDIKLQNVKRKHILVSRLSFNKLAFAVNSLSDFRKQQTTIAAKIRPILIKNCGVAVTTAMLDLLKLFFIKFVSIEPAYFRRYGVMFDSLNIFFHLFLILLSFSQWREMLTTIC